jgi:hypothetical protein
MRFFVVKIGKLLELKCKNKPKDALKSNMGNKKT